MLFVSLKASSAYIVTDGPLACGTFRVSVLINAVKRVGLYFLSPASAETCVPNGNQALVSVSAFRVSSIRVVTLARC